MSDGPHRSLKMPRGWTTFAERADNRAYALDEVCRALPRVVESTWAAEVPKELVAALKRRLDGEQLSLLDDSTGEQLADLHVLAPSRLGDVLLECVEHSLARGLKPPEALVDGLAAALKERALRGVRQVEEHYLRESNERRADHVRTRLEEAIGVTRWENFARALLESKPLADPGTEPLKRRSLDDGVDL